MRSRLLVPQYSHVRLQHLSETALPGGCPACRKPGDIALHYYQVHYVGGADVPTERVVGEVCCRHCAKALPTMLWPDAWVAVFERERGGLPLAEIDEDVKRRARRNVAIIGGVLIGVIVLALGMLAVLQFYDSDDLAGAHEPPSLRTADVGHVFTGVASETTPDNGYAMGNYAYVVRELRADSAVLQRSRDTIPVSRRYDYDPALATFTGPRYTFSRDEATRALESERDGVPHRVYTQLIYRLPATSDE